MRIALMTEPQQGLDYAGVLAIARTAEEVGFEAFFRSDHFSSFPGEPGRPTTDCWATLAGLARETSRIGLGSLVSPVTFRIPGAFAKLVATVHEMSGERIEVGVGAGWNEDEHAQLGIPFPDDRERVDMLEEELRILRGLWDEPDGWGVEGRHWTVRGSLFRPRGRRPRIIVGGSGRPRSMRLAVAWADEYNISSSGPEEVRGVQERLDAACRAGGREPGSLVRSVMVGVLIGRDEEDLGRRTREQLAVFGEAAADGEAWLAARRGRWVMGTPDAARARMAEYAAARVERLMLQTFLPWDLEHVRLVGATLLG